MRQRFRHRKIIEWHCPKCGKIFGAKSQAFTVKLGNRELPACNECNCRLMRRSFDELRK